MLAKGLVILSSVAFAVTGLGYLVAPGTMLTVVGIESAATSDFLIRTEGVALLAGAGFLWAVRDGTPTQLRLVLLSIAFYCIVGALVDLAAFDRGVVGVASVPSGIVRIGVGGVCLVAAWRVSRARWRRIGGK